MDKNLIKKVISYTMIILVMIFTLVGLLAIWGVLAPQVIERSFVTLGLLFVASLISFVIIKLLDK